MKYAVLYGSVREGRQGIKAARFVVRQIEARGDEAVLVDAEEQDLPFLEKRYKDYGPGEAPEALDKLAALYREVDGFVIVSGEYNYSIPPALKNMIDYFVEEYRWRPSAIVSYSAGGFGGVRVAMQLPAMLGVLGMPAIPSVFAISEVQNAFDEEGNDPTGQYQKRIGRFLDELGWYAEALKARREQGVPY